MYLDENMFGLSVAFGTAGLFTEKSSYSQVLCSLVLHLAVLTTLLIYPHDVVSYPHPLLWLTHPVLLTMERGALAVYRLCPSESVLL